MKLTLFPRQFLLHGKLPQKGWPSKQYPDGLSCIVYHAIFDPVGDCAASWQYEVHDIYLKDSKLELLDNSLQNSYCTYLAFIWQDSQYQTLNQPGHYITNSQNT